MYEVDNLFAWVMQHSTQEVVGILVGIIAVATPLACIVLAFIDTVIDYALRYVNEDTKERTTVAKFISKEHDGITKWRKLIEDKSDDEIINATVGDIYYGVDGDSDWLYIEPARNGGWTCCYADSIKKRKTDIIVKTSVREIKRVLQSETLTRINWGKYSGKPSVILALMSLAVFFLPLWLILSVGICYAVLRTARFVTRYSKKFNTHIKKEH